jgi:hypothetical protein
MLYFVLIVPNVAVCIPVLPQRHLFEEPLSQDVSCLLTVDPPPWKADRAAKVYIRLENRTNTAVDLEIVPELYLRNFLEGTYYSPADIVQNKAFEHVANGRLGNLALVNIHLNRNSSSTFRIDAAKLKWDMEISAVIGPPSRSLAALPRGPYWLRLQVFDRNGKLVKSNEVRVMLEKADSEKR